MAQLNVEPKRNNNWWIWILVIIAIFLLWWFFIRRDKQMDSMRLTPMDSTIINDSTALNIDTVEPTEDSAARIEHLSN